MRNFNSISFKTPTSSSFDAKQSLYSYRTLTISSFVSCAKFSKIGTCDILKLSTRFRTNRAVLRYQFNFLASVIPGGSEYCCNCHLPLVKIWVIPSQSSIGDLYVSGVGTLTPVTLDTNFKRFIGILARCMRDSQNCLSASFKDASIS